MKVLLKKNIDKLGHVGEVVDVKPGYARNYLVPQGLAIEPTEMNLKAIEAEKQRYLAELATQREATEAQAATVRGKEITIAARANEEGHLYGSIGPAQICSALAEEGLFVESENVALDEPIRQLDKYDITLRFADDITATIHVWVVPAHEEGAEGDRVEGDRVEGEVAAPPADDADAGDAPAAEADPDATASE